MKWSFKQDKLISALVLLNNKYGCVGLKMGTEAEANSFEEINRIRHLAQGRVPIIVKIGGPEARNDIKELLKIGIDGFIAPMVESPYGLRLFIRTLKELAGDIRFNKLIKGINIETATTYKQLDEIFSIPEVRNLQQITIGRGDLSSSFEKQIEDEDIFTIARVITQKAQKLGIKVSVGGGITPDGAVRVAQHIKPDKINTRHVVFDLSKCLNLIEAIYLALDFEIGLLHIDEKKTSSVEVNYVKRRIEELKFRQTCYTPQSTSSQIPKVR